MNAILLSTKPMKLESLPNPESVAARLYFHLFCDDGTINSGETSALYDESHGTEDQDTELETVEEWAIFTASRYATKHGLNLNNA